jgi:hypothetical protein
LKLNCQMNKTGKMNCERCKTNLVEYLEGLLPEQESGEVRLHLTECSSCAGFAEYLSQTLSVIDNSLIKEPNHFLYTRIAARMQNHGSKSVRNPGLLKVLQPALFTILLIAAMVAGIAIGNLPRLPERDQYAMENLDPWLNEIQSEPLETFLMDK